MILSYILPFVSALPGALAAIACTKPSVRSEWRELTDIQQRDYIDAVICLKMAPSHLNASIGSPSRFDDFVYTHTEAIDTTHSMAVFLPWHRSFIHIYETALRNECGYPGTLPFWDWTVDSQEPESSSLWSDLSFGGDGDSSTPERCVRSGPFSMFSSTFPDVACLSRSIAGRLGGTANFYTPEAIYRLISMSDTYDTFRQNLEHGPHKNVHIGIGGDMSVLGKSANDPIFMLHHANVDRIWSIWQTLRSDQVTAYSGQNANNSTARTTDKLPVFGVMANHPYKVSHVLNTTSGRPLCYTYSNSIKAGISWNGRLHQKRSLEYVSTARLDAEKIVSAADPYAHGTISMITPPGYDRSNKHKIRCATRIPDDFALEMQYDDNMMLQLRSEENGQCAFTNFINWGYPQYKSHVLPSSADDTGFTSITNEELANYYETYDTIISDFNSYIN
ncbi:hypothetical protein BASA50_003600 [Batrachochytrium salamandrivorans]|uniref:Tyrosinase copper-binding domain-containing protein n=1 Tax=Batrachochytrium salamandrivorans TaxID=1357716 RepID=A0ABQ8FHW2_9FUNG|nr:hypothetical protein BASA60_008054 [Batrachochytrium salamandrivorans]KAH6598562.1 hypothetical protein BASA50_003600 [Batrachochytrium salamandrivorans]KAH6600740.1 hypothetical protein BASA61_002157 [Batrachochytrium salamandrivorans]KAJ1334716.1 hypothetical protein BSLG_007871 [Batrachochytrium salamandrivorans]